MGNIVTCGPNTALVVSGGRESTIRIGGRAVVFPCIQRVDRLSLELRTLNVRSVNATTLQGVRISVEGIAQVKVSGYSYVACAPRVSLCDGRAARSALCVCARGCAWGGLCADLGWSLL